MAFVGFRGRREQWLGKTIRKLEAIGQRNATDGSRLLVFLPATAGNVPSDNTLNGHDFGRPSNHDSSFERRSLFVGQPGQVGRIGGNQVVGNQVEFPDEIEESGRNLGEQHPFPGHWVRQHHVKRTHSVAGHNQKPRGLPFAGGNRVHIPNFALAASGIGEVGRFDGGLGVGAAHFADHDTSACSLTQGRRHSPRAEVRHES